MSNNNKTTVLNLRDKTLMFIFLGEQFILNLTEGDLEDCWGSITTKDGDIYDTNLVVDTSIESEPPTISFSVYPVKINAEGRMEIQTQDTRFEDLQIDKVIGTVEEYFNN